MRWSRGDAQDIDRDDLDLGRCALARGFVRLVRPDGHTWDFGLWCNPDARAIIRLNTNVVDDIECDTDQEFVDMVRALVKWHCPDGGRLVVDVGVGTEVGDRMRAALLRMGLLEAPDSPAPWVRAVPATTVIDAVRPPAASALSAGVDDPGVGIPEPQPPQAAAAELGV